jgi:hypothetical protein
MVVISHQAIGIALPPLLLALSGQQPEKLTAVVVIEVQVALSERSIC